MPWEEKEEGRPSSCEGHKDVGTDLIAKELEKEGGIG